MKFSKNFEFIIYMLIRFIFIFLLTFFWLIIKENSYFSKLHFVDLLPVSYVYLLFVVWCVVNVFSFVEDILIYNYTLISRIILTISFVLFVAVCHFTNNN